MNFVKQLILHTVTALWLFGGVEQNPFAHANFSDVDLGEREFLLKLYVEQKQEAYEGKIQAQRQEAIRQHKRQEEEAKAQALVDLHAQEEAKIAQEVERLKAVLEEEARRKEAEHNSTALTAEVNLSTQRMRLYRDGELLHEWKVSTGRHGHATPAGSYQPILLEKMHYSKQYHNSPMPYSVFFLGGYAVHGTRAVSRLGRRASHGCVRLKTAHAKQFYHLVQRDGKHATTIRIVN